MGHVISTEAQARNQDSDTKTADLVVITLPDPTNPATFHLATQDCEVDGQDYDGRIKAMPTITYSAGGNANGGEFVIDNARNEYGPAFITETRALDGGSVVITRAWKLNDGTWQKQDPATGKVYELARGILQTQPVSDTEVKCNFIDDFSDTSVKIGGEQIAQHCLEIFNVNGTHPLGGNCGWLPSMGGNPLECDHTVDGPNGCKAHGNTRSSGIPDLKPRPVAITSSVGRPGLIRPGDDDTGGYGIHPRKPIGLDPDLRIPFMN